MQCQEGEIMAKVLNYGMVGGGPDAFIGDAHRRAISLDESARLVAGVFSRNAEKSKKMGEVLHIEEERCYKDYERWHWRKRKGKTALILL